MTSEVETLILKKNSTEILFDKKMVNKYRKWFLLTTEFYNISNDAALLVSKNWNPEGKSYVHLEGTVVKKQENTTTKKIATQKMHANELHAKLGHPG